MGKQVRAKVSSQALPDGRHSAVVDLCVSAVVNRAAEDVALACRFLELARVIPAERVRARRPCPVPLHVMLKAAALMRLLRWQDLPGSPAASLPHPQGVLDDMARHPDQQRVDAEGIARRLLSVWLSTMSWSPLVPRTDVVVQDVRSQPLADELAQLLWQFRHLMDDHHDNDSRKEG